MTADTDRIATIIISLDADQARALRIPCPVCSAPIDVPCHPAAYPDQAVAPHLARVDAARPFGGTMGDLVAAQQRHFSALNSPRLGDKRRAWHEAMIELMTATMRSVAEELRRQAPNGQDGAA